MRFGRISKAVGVAAAAALALSACAGNSGGTSPSTAAAASKSGGSATVVEVNAFNTFNPNTADGNTDINSKISYATHSGFFYIDNKLNVVRNEKFGKMEKVSDNPLTVKYTINDGVKWSDGTPVTAADLVLQWAAFSGYYDDADAEAKTGTSYFSYAGDPTGIALTDFPELGDDGRSMTLKYSKPFADWEIAIGGPGIDIPAHVLAKKAGLADAKAFVDLVKGMPRGDAKAPKPANAQLKAMADMWNTGFDTKTLPADPEPLPLQRPLHRQGCQPGPVPDHGQEQGLQLGSGSQAGRDHRPLHRFRSRPGAGAQERRGRHHRTAGFGRHGRAAQGPRKPGRHGRGRKPACPTTTST